MTNGQANFKFGLIIASLFSKKLEINPSST